MLGGLGGSSFFQLDATNGAGFGGAVGLFESSAVTITGSTFSNNHATNVSDGGGVAMYQTGTVEISNGTFSGQSAGRGSAIYAFRAGVASDLRYSSFSGNTGSVAIYLDVPGAAIRLQGVVFANHPDGACGGFQSAQSAGDNLSDQASCFAPDASLNDRVITGTPLLGTLGDHGGPTQTFDLPAGSPAIDGVVHNPCPPPNTDQRGYLRPAGPRCDIGAFEAGALSPTPTPTVTNTPTLTPTASRTPTATATSTPTATATLTPTTTATATQTLTPTATATSTATPTPTPTSTPATIPTATPTVTPTPFLRPNVGVLAAPSGTAGRLRVTVTARDAGCAPNNQLSALHFTATTNATVDAGTVTAGTGDFTVPLAGGPAQATFFVTRVAASQPATVSLVVTDGCGQWPTFVGGGPGAF